MKPAIILLAFFLVAIPAGAEYFKYTDKDGNVRYTDDLTQVPPDQRASVTPYESVIPEPAPPSEPAATPKEDLESARKRLDERKEVLDQMFADLVAEKDALLKGQEESPPQGEDLDAYNRKIADLNVRITAYEAEREAFNAEVRVYNDAVIREIEAQKKANDQAPSQ